jgi:hypothetical protein
VRGKAGFLGREPRLGLSRGSISTADGPNRFRRTRRFPPGNTAYLPVSPRSYDRTTTAFLVAGGRGRATRAGKRQAGEGRKLLGDRTRGRRLARSLSSTFLIDAALASRLPVLPLNTAKCHPESRSALLLPRPSPLHQGLSQRTGACHPGYFQASQILCLTEQWSGTWLRGTVPWVLYRRFVFPRCSNSHTQANFVAPSSLK